MKLQNTHIIALVNHKGGCGKTTTAVNLAAACALEGYRVCIVDTDEQCNATDGFGINRDQLAKEGRHTVLDAYLLKRPANRIAFPITDAEGAARLDGHIFIVPGHRGLSQVTPKLEAELHSAIAADESSTLDADDIRHEQRTRLRNSLESLRGEFDFVFVDTPPDLGFQTTTALIAADWFILPVFPSGYDLKGLEKLIFTTKKVRDRYNSSLGLLGVLLGNKDARAKLDNDIYAMLGEYFKHRVFETTISSSVKQREATLYGLSVLEHADAHKSSEEFRALGREVISRIREEEAEEERAQLMEANR